MSKCQKSRRGGFRTFAVATSLLLGCAVAAHAGERLPLGAPTDSASLTFVEARAGDWGLEIADREGTRLTQPQPLRVQTIDAHGKVDDFASGYRTVKRTRDGLEGEGMVRVGGRDLFRVEDRWSLRDGIVTVHRSVHVLADRPGGFASAISLQLQPGLSWDNAKILAPGILYGDPTYDGERSPGGTLFFAARRIGLREDVLPAPMLGLLLDGGESVTLLDPAPKGDTTEADTTLASPVVIDRRLRFGALTVEQAAGAPVSLGFSMPGSVQRYAPPVQKTDNGSTPATSNAIPSSAPANASGPQWVRRYNPIARGDDQSYQVSFRLGREASFRDFTRDDWRWAWDTLKPPINYIDIDRMRRVLVDRLEANAATIDGRTGEPFVLNTVTDKLQWNWTMIGMGFVTKNLECADELLREADRDPSPRGQAMRRTGLAIIKSMIDALPTVPLQGTGYDLATGKPWDHVWLAPWLRNATEDMRVLVRTYQRERALGRPHPEWIQWVETYVDWLVLQQRPDGSFPRRWKTGSDEAAEPSGTASYAPVPLLVLMFQETGNVRYKEAALRAGDYVWSNWGQNGLFIGGASDNPDITDKEAGMLSLEAYQSLYDLTEDPKWLDRAKAAANFAESWIWIWNLPMPADADDSQLSWKKGVPTVGLQGITALSAGGADEYLDWAVPSYAKLYKETGDRHYLDVALVLLHDTKSMVSLPDRLYDMRGPGWQQEHWSMGPGGGGRGWASHRLWLPWVTANHLNGIYGLEELDLVLFHQMSAPPHIGQPKISRPATGKT